MQRQVLNSQKKGGGVWTAFEDPDAAPTKELKPFEGRVQRFRVRHLRVPGEVKSFAWTQRGVPQSYAKALTQMWHWEQSCYGVQCPLPPALTALAN